MPPRCPGPDASRQALRRYYQQTTDVAALDLFLEARGCAPAEPLPAEAETEINAGGRDGRIVRQRLVHSSFFLSHRLAEGLHRIFLSPQTI